MYINKNVRKLFLAKIFRLSCRFLLALADRNFLINVAIPSGWTHLGLNYIGPNNGQGIRVYYDGAQAGSDKMKYPKTYQPGASRVILGRELINVDAGYASVDVDELFFFNEALSDQNIQHLN